MSIYIYLYWCFFFAENKPKPNKHTVIDSRELAYKSLVFFFCRKNQTKTQYTVIDSRELAYKSLAFVVAQK